MVGRDRGSKAEGFLRAPDAGAVQMQGDRLGHRRPWKAQSSMLLPWLSYKKLLCL